MKAVKKLILAVMVALVAFTPLPFVWGAGIAVAAVKGIDLTMFLHRLAQKYRHVDSDVDGATVEKNKARYKKNRKARYYNRIGKHWDVRSFPSDMKVLSAAGDNPARLSVAGVQGITAEYLGSNLFGRQRVSFKFPLDDGNRAEAVNNYIVSNALYGLEVKCGRDGSYYVESDSAKAMDDFVKGYCPSRSSLVEREVTTVNQFMVTGCRSFEEAVEKYKANPQAYEPVNTYCRWRDTVDGVSDEEHLAAGTPYVVNSVLSGTYIVNQAKKEVFSRDVRYNVPVDVSAAAARSNASEAYVDVRDIDKVEDRSHDEPVYTDGIDYPVERVVSLGDKGYARCYDVSQAKERLAGAGIYMCFRDPARMLEVLSGRAPLTDCLFYIDTVPPVAQDDEIVVSLPMKDEYLERVLMRNPDVPILEKEGYMSRYEASLTSMMSKFDADGYVTAQIEPPIDLSEAKVNGLPVQQYLERCDSMVSKGVADQFEDMSSLATWINDALAIENVYFDVDIKSKKLNLYSTVKGSEGEFTIRESTDVDADQLEALVTLNPSQVELKDFLMRGHPDCFATYVDKDKRQSDALSDFITRRDHLVLPEGTVTVTKSEGERNPEVVYKEKKYTSRKKYKGPSIG